jgi:hypothetical protein
MQKISFFYLLFAAFGSFFAFQFCIKPPDYGDAPQIAFKSLSRNAIDQTSPNLTKIDTLFVTFTYTDGNGDLGTKDNAEKNAFAYDGRDGFKKEFAIPYIEEQGAGNGISGEITVAITNDQGMCCIFNDGTSGCNSTLQLQSTDTFFYKLQIKDRAGNLSNEIVTPPIIINCKK